MRQINLGESRLKGGDTLSVSGEEAVRRGFRVCKECEKVQIPGQEPNHTSTCTAKEQEEDCLFAYREFQSVEF